MTDNEIRVAIAEECGFTDVTPGSHFNLPCGRWKGRFTTVLPDYASCLNAMHSAEKIMTQEQRVDYMNELARVCGNQYEKPFATASQRAEAFLKTLGKWK